MKKVTFLLLICLSFISFSSNAQSMMGRGMGGMGYGGMGYGGAQMSQPQSQPRRPDINFIGACGYFAIDSDEAIEKLKIKKDQDKEQEIAELIKVYNSELDALVDDYRNDIDVLEFAKESVDMAEGNMNAMRDVMKKVSISSRVIRPKTLEIHKKLNDSISAILNAKELKKWEKYYEHLCESNLFKPKSPTNKGPKGKDADTDDEDKNESLDADGKPTF